MLTYILDILGRWCAWECGNQPSANDGQRKFDHRGRVGDVEPKRVAPNGRRNRGRNGTKLAPTRHRQRIPFRKGRAGPPGHYKQFRGEG